jgi:hypothetical protein
MGFKEVELSRHAESTKLVTSGFTVSLIFSLVTSVQCSYKAVMVIKL